MVNYFTVPKGMFNMDLTNNQTIERYLEHTSDHPDVLIKPIIHGKPTGFSYESIISFIERLYTKEEFIITFEDAYKDSKVILAIMESSRKKQVVEVSY